MLAEQTERAGVDGRWINQVTEVVLDCEPITKSGRVVVETVDVAEVGGVCEVVGRSHGVVPLLVLME